MPTEHNARANLLDPADANVTDMRLSFKLFFGTLAVSVCFSLSSLAATGTSGAFETNSAMQRARPYFDIDQQVFGPAAARSIPGWLAECSRRTDLELVRCLLMHVHAAREPSLPVQSSLTGALSGDPSTCAALAALVLVTDREERWRAVLLEEHVVLRLADSDVYVELLESGRRLPPEEIISLTSKELGRLTETGRAGFVPYYTDNLASRVDSPGKSRALYKQALRLAPSSARIHYNYGTFLLRQGATSEALTMLTKALELDPDLPRVHENLCIASRRVGDTANSSFCDDTVTAKPQEDSSH